MRKSDKRKLVDNREVTCFCGSPAHLASNARKYGRAYGTGQGWFCARWPECEGYVEVPIQTVGPWARWLTP